MKYMRNYYFILGNGFTIDFLKHIKKLDEIDVFNLFSQGDQVPYPQDKEPGFLSFKRCPNLWNLGARSYMNNTDSMTLIEDIITCANMAHNSTRRHINSTYISAYQELSAYLKSLFVYYNNKLDSTDFKESVQDWGWLKMLKKLNDSSQCSNITIVTYNYDIFLERILVENNINFEISGFEDSKYFPEEQCKIKIIKPHGSISFSYADPIDPSRFKISSSVRELTNGKVSDYKVNYTELDNIYMFNAMIPPAGDSFKLTNDNNLNIDSDESWATTLRKLTLIEANKLNYGDELLICGLSYWHVDRTELDNILTSIHGDVNVKVLNPNPSNTFGAVLNSLFSNNIFYRNSNVLGGLYND
jgi:hypothetical protein